MLPVIGILSHPGDGAAGRLTNDTRASYIAASYVKFVKSGGARVIPLIYNEKPQILNKKLNIVNGVILTGGSCKSGSYYEYVIKKNEAGSHFPLIAICLGFELLAMIVSKHNADEGSQPHTVQLCPPVSLRRYAPQIHCVGVEPELIIFPDLLQVLIHADPDERVARVREEVDERFGNIGGYGVSPERFEKNKNLHSFFRIVTISECRDKKCSKTVLISTRSMYLLSKHESTLWLLSSGTLKCVKNAFEWGLEKIPHSPAAVQVTQNVANFLVR
ncbi:gamma-glutamyl hydrolase [Striga asiatica]|uniref:folate gamma-glutamyl hydrolase n=1 Tax=Striga asiatica TaxID=4170 RepID=A0A5A7R942_STRAF|nr:gamma-glutamyl hydrolase [Striga asiatica]